MAEKRIIGPTAPPTLQNVLNSILAQATTSIQVAKVGKISSYNSALNTAEVTICSKAELADGRVFDYPLLVDCPVFKITGGTSYLSMPIMAGDECLVVFNDFDIDNWWVSGSSSLPATSRKHSIGDGFVLVGFNSIPNAIPAMSAVVELFGGTNRIAIGNAVVSLFGLMNQLIDTLVAGTVTMGLTELPFSPTTITALQAAKVQFALLLSQGSSPT